MIKEMAVNKMAARQCEHRKEILRGEKVSYAVVEA